MWWEFARWNRHIATTANTIEWLHEEFQAADRVLLSANAAAPASHQATPPQTV